MKNIVLATAALLLTAVAALADPVEGVWKTEVDDGAYAQINMAPCGDKICGTIAKTFNATGEYQSPNLGKTLAIDMVPNGDGTYSGSVWRPSNNKVYIGKMTLRGDKLKLKGCVAGGLICSAQDWVRLN